MTNKKLVYLRLKYAFTNKLISWKTEKTKLTLIFEKPLPLELEQEITSHIKAILNPPKHIPLQILPTKPPNNTPNKSR